MIPTVPKPAAEKTFVVAAVILGLFAFVQLIAAVVALAPQVRFTTEGSRSDGAAAGTGSPGAPTTTAAAGTPTEQVIARAQSLLEQGNEARGGGDLQAALNAFGEADHLVPNEPGILIQMAGVLEAMGKRVEAAEAYQAILALPVNPANPDFPAIRLQAEQRAAALRGGAASEGGAPSASLMRDEIGIPIGSSLGIIEARIDDSDAGFKHLKIATKATQTETIEPGDLKIAVTFYEQNDYSEILPTTSGMKSEWLTPEIDWANGEPELVDVRYSMPADDRGDLPPLQYYGWVLGIYYKGGLQDSRAEPVTLLDEFPLPLTRDDL